MKFVTFAAAADPAGVDDFRDWFSRDYAPGFARNATGLRGCLVRFPHSPPQGLSEQLRREPDPSFPACDVVFETWFSSTEDYRRTVRMCGDAFRRHVGSFMSYRCTPALEKDPRMAEAGPSGQRPEMTVVIPVRWRPGSDARRHWEEHVPVALRVHRGLSKYERNWVDEVMAISPGVVPVHGFADFSFPTIEHFLHEFYPTMADRHEIQQDIDDFIAEAWSIYLDDAIPIPVGPA